MDIDPVIRHLKISGRVQGVGFRYHFTRAARALGVTGWVRNCRDGSVEAMIAGPSTAVDSLIAWARRGPPQAAVEEVAVTAGSGSFSGFATQPTE